MNILKRNSVDASWHLIYKLILLRPHINFLQLAMNYLPKRLILQLKKGSCLRCSSKKWFCCRKVQNQKRIFSHLWIQNMVQILIISRLKFATFLHKKLWKQIKLGSSNDKWLVTLFTQRKQLSALVLRNFIFV